MIYDFTTSEEVFLRNFGETSQGRDLKRLLHNIRSNVDRTSNIPKDSDYGAQVEGRRLVSEVISSIIDRMSRKEPDTYKEELGNDDFS